VTWGEFKARVEAAGVTDVDKIHYTTRGVPTAPEYGNSG